MRILAGVLTLALGAAPAAAAEKTKLAVLDLAGKGVEANLAGNLTDIVTVSLNQLGVFDVLSRADILQMLALEQQKQMLGCDDTSCLAEIGGALGVGLLVSGSIGKVGSSFIINLALTDTRAVKVLAREQRQVKSEDDLTAQLEAATRFLVRGLLEGRQGELILKASETGAEVEVDGRIVGVTPLGRQTLAGGPHTLKVHKKGFVSWAHDIDIQSDQPLVVDAAMVPSVEFIDEYDSSAFRWRLAAYLAGGVGVALLAGGVAGYAYNSGEIKKYEDDLAADNCQANAPIAPTVDCSVYGTRKSSIESLDQAMVGLMVGGGVAAAAGVVLFLYGPEPGVYDQYKSSASVGAVTVLPTAHGAVASALLRF